MSTETSSTMPVPVPSTPVAPGRCFVCLVDEDPSSTDDWVRPCPCSLEGHQDCLMAWISELEHEGKPLQCPICKATINVDEPFDPAVALANRLYKSFSRVSPSLLVAGVMFGTSVGLGAYGAIALRTFAGVEGYVRFVYDLKKGTVRRWNLAALPAIAPAFLIGQTVPALGNLVFLPVAFIYGTVQSAMEPGFFSWPPSPELALASFPVVRALYRNFWREFVQPYEKRFERRIAGLPEPHPDPEPQGAQANQRARDAQDEGGNGGGGGGGAFAGMLDAAMNLLEIPELDVNVQVQEEIIHGHEPPHHGEMDDRIEIEVAGFVDDGQDGHQGHDRHEDAIQELGIDGPAPAPPDFGPGPQPHGGNAVPLPPPEPEPQRQWNLHTSLRDVANSLAAALLLPAISAGMGELLRLALPKHLTSRSLAAYPSFTFLGPSHLRPGLLQVQWGRSLIGGCVYLVLRDAFRFYTKYRRAVSQPLRKVRNIDRPRGGSS